jgi:RND family efflux transporter MFP subunit
MRVLESFRCRNSPLLVQTALRFPEQELLNYPMMKTLSICSLGVLLHVGLVAIVSAQQMPPSPVSYTEVKEYPLRRSVQLPGSVEAVKVSTVASEIAGMVVEFSAREGAAVTKGQPLARLRRENHQLSLTSAEAQLQEDEARHKLAERNLERTRELFGSKDVSQKQLDDAQFELNAWQGRVDKQRAEIAKIKDELDRHTIVAPFGGVVVKEFTELGQWLAEGGPVVELMSLDEMDVVAEVPERYFNSLKPRARTQVIFEALSGLRVDGRVSAIIPRADPQARTFRAKIRIPNPGNRIGAGMLAQISLPEGEPYRAVVVPKDAIVTRGPQKLIYLVNGDNKIAEVPVQVGAGVGAWIEVQGGVQAGQKVVTRGNERLMNGQAVQGQPLEMRLP